MGRATFVTLDMLGALHAAEIEAGLRGDLDAAGLHFDRCEALMRAAIAQTPATPGEAIEAMGLKHTQMFATLFDGITRHSPEGFNFKRRAEEVGWKEAVRNRDQGTWDWTENRPINPGG